MQTETPNKVMTTENGHERAGRPSSRGWLPRLLFDLVVIALLLWLSVPMRWEATRGDFWLDEADYALAATRGFQANRYDRSEAPADPEKLVRLRHYHPPLIAHIVGLAMRHNNSDRYLRLPSVIAGALTVGLVYLCGLYLFAPRGDPHSRWAPRFIAAACALVLIPAPAHIRASSHALPWAFITLWLVGIVLCTAAYARTRHFAWLAGLGLTLGLLFVTSEYVAVAGLALLVASPFLFWYDLRDRLRRKRLAIGLICCTLACLIIVVIFWPVGLTGGLPKMLGHYIAMADDVWRVEIMDQWYDRAPKWAFYHWYSTLYPAYTYWYGAGAIGLLALTVLRKLTVGVVSLLVLTGVVLLASHESHIIGPEYLSHALPLMTLCGGLVFAAIIRLHAPTASALAMLCAALVVNSKVGGPLSGMDERSQVSRWPEAAAFLKARWGRDDRMLAPPFGGVARWYLVHGAATPAEEYRVQVVPPTNAKERLLDEMSIGAYRFVAIGNTFMDWAQTDNRIRLMIASWPVIWMSDEPSNAPSRLVIYEVPKGTNRTQPVKVPQKQ